MTEGTDSSDPSPWEHGTLEHARDGRDRTRRRALIGVVVGIIALGALAVAAVTFGFLRSVEDGAARLVPADAPVYASVVVDPSGSQMLALRDVMARFPLDVDTDGAETPADVIAKLLDDELDDLGLDYDTDIRPWLGRQVALFFLAARQGDADDVIAEPITGAQDGAVLLATNDPDATRAAIAKVLDAQQAPDVTKRTHEDVEYRIVGAGEGDETAYGIVSGYLVAGTERGVQRVIETATADDGLAHADRFEDVVDDLPDDHLVAYYVNPAALVEVGDAAAGGAAGFAGPGPADVGPTAGVILVREDGIVLDSFASFSDDSAYRPLLDAVTTASPVSRLPGDAWFAFGLDDLGEIASAYLDVSFSRPAGGGTEEVEAAFREETGLDLREDVLDWMQSAALFARGGDLFSLRGALVVESGDRLASARLLEATRAFLEGQAVATEDVEVAGLGGFRVQAPGIPVPILAVAGDEVVVGVGQDAVRAAIEPDTTLAEQDSFRAATEALGGAEPNVYLDLPAVIRLVEASLGASGDLPSTYTQDVRPYLEPLGAVAGATSVDDGRVRQRVFIGVRGTGDEEATASSAP